MSSLGEGTAIMRRDYKGNPYTKHHMAPHGYWKERKRQLWGNGLGSPRLCSATSSPGEEAQPDRWEVGMTIWSL
jgi:hypothetical protein